MPEKQKTPTRPVAKTLQIVKQNKKLLLGAGLVAAAVDFVLGIGAQQGGNTGQSFWMAIVFAAFLWAAAKLTDYKNPKLNIRKVFYEGSNTFIKLFIVIMFWVVCLTPFLLGSLVFAQINSTVITATTLEKSIAFGVWVFLTVLSLYLVFRTVFAAVMVSSNTPWRAIKRSWNMTKRRVLWLAFNLLGWIIITSIPAIVVYVVSVSGVLVQPLYINSLQNVASALIYIFVLPIISVLLYQLYTYEKSSRPRR